MERGREGGKEVEGGCTEERAGAGREGVGEGGRDKGREKILF